MVLLVNVSEIPSYQTGLASFPDSLCLYGHMTTRPCDAHVLFREVVLGLSEVFYLFII